MMIHRIPVTDLNDPAISVYTKLTENQLRHYYEPHGGIFIAESPMVIERALHAGIKPLSVLAENRYAESDGEGLFSVLGDIPVYTGSYDILKELTGFPLTRGILCAMKRPDPVPASELLEKSGRIAVLEDVMNPTNIGAIFRSAAALSFDAVLLAGGCSDPLMRRAARVSVGTVFQIPWTRIGEGSGAWQTEGFELLKRNGFTTCAMALGDESVPLPAPELKNADKLAVFLGSEGYGLRPETVELCDRRVRIPMAEGVDSLNVAAASAVAFWELGNRNGESI